MLKLLYFCAFLDLYYLNVSSKKMDEPVSLTCVMCICQAVSGCNFNKTCTDTCGPFRVSKTYWEEAGMPTINRMPTNDPNAFSICANSGLCGFHMIQKYMTKFQKDCNGDGVIDCIDFMKIHKLGSENCEDDVPETYQDRYDFCQDVIDI